MSRVKIILTGGTLNVNDNTAVPLNFSIGEIKDISKRNSTFSKTIKIKGTKNNNKLFGNLFKINKTFDTFNPNLRAKATLTINDIPVINNGFIQLKDINKLNNSDNEGNLIEYSIVFYDATASFYQDLADLELTDIDLSQWNHTLESDTIINAQTAHTFSNVYTYPLTHSTLRQKPLAYITKDFHPAIFVRSYFDKIFDNAGYTYEITPSTLLDNLIIPYTGAYPELDDATITRNKFSVGQSGDSTTTAFSFKSPDEFSAETRVIEFNDKTTSPFFDNNDNFILSSHTHNSQEYTDFTYNVNIPYKIRFNSNFDGIGRLASPPSNFTFEFRISKNGTPINGANWRKFEKFEGIGIQFSSNTTDVNYKGATFFEDVATFTITEPLFSGNNVVVETSIVENNVITRVDSTGLLKQTQLFIDVSGATFSAQPVKLGLTDGNPILLNEFIPKEIKQTEFISSLVKMFNLYIEPNNEKPKKLIIQPRTVFFSGGTTQDWTLKKDYSREDKIQLLSEIQNRELKLSYRPDSDYYNTNYKQRTKKIFGEKSVFYENEFVTGSKVIEPIFSPTPSVTSADKQFILPYIKTNLPKNNIRILQYDNSATAATSSNAFYNYTFLRINQGNVFGSVFPSVYPYAGHLNNPNNPTSDLNFDLSDYVYYSTISASTNQTLFAKYWQNQFNQIETGTLVTSSFFLKESDILNLNFRNKIFVKDSYYIINRIIDYNPNGNGLTKVELLKTPQGETIKPTTTPLSKVYDIQSLVDIDLTRGDLNLFETSDSNRIDESVNDVGIIGRDNIVRGNVSDSIMVGNNNQIGFGATAVGIIGASGCTISSNSRNSFVIGEDNVSLTGDNVVRIAGVTIQNGNITTTGTTSAGGDDREIQFNNDGVLSGDSTFSFLNNIVNVPNLLSSGSVSASTLFSGSTDLNDIFLSSPSTLSEVLTAGNTSGSKDILMSGSRKLTFVNSTDYTIGKEATGLVINSLTGIIAKVLPFNTTFSIINNKSVLSDGTNSFTSSVANNSIEFDNSSFTSTLFFTTPTSNKNITLKDETGTVALLTDLTQVQGGANINTGGTSSIPIVNLDDDIELNSVSGNSISASTIYSGSTDLSDLFVSDLTTPMSVITQSAYTLSDSDGTIFAQTSGNSITLTFPAISASTAGKTYTAKKIGANNLTYESTPPNLFDDSFSAETFVLNIPSRTYQNDGLNSWWLIGAGD